MSIVLNLPNSSPWLESVVGPHMASHHTQWEREQEAGMRAFHAEDSDGVERAWQSGLDIARCHFGSDDPCLASSLTNYGFAERRLDRVEKGTEALHEALGVWERCWRGLDQASSDMGSYRHPAQVFECLDRLIREGFATTLRILDHDDPPTGRFEQWLPLRSVRHAQFRRLLGAVLLTVSWPAEESGPSADSSRSRMCWTSGEISSQEVA